MYKLIKLLLYRIFFFVFFIISFIFINGRVQAEESTETILLKELIQKDYPDIENRDDFTKTNFLREYAFENTDLAPSEDTPIRLKSHQSAPQILAEFFQDKGGVWCGDSANTLLKIYEMYGIQSYILSVGKQGLITHAINLVEINFKGRKILAIQDPYFNITFVKKEDGEPYDYFELIEKLKGKKHDEIIIQEGNAKKKDIIALSSLDLSERKTSYWKCGGDIKFIKNLPNNRKKYKGDFNLKMFESCHFLVKDTKLFLKSEGYPEDLRYLYLYPFAISSLKEGYYSGTEEKINNYIKALYAKPIETKIKNSNNRGEK